VSHVMRSINVRYLLTYLLLFKNQGEIKKSILHIPKLQLMDICYASFTFAYVTASILF